MNNIVNKELLLLKPLFEYLSPEGRQVIIDYSSLDEKESCSHQFKSDYNVKNIIAFACFDAVCKNISNEGSLKIEDLRMNQHINYENDGTYIFKGEDESIKGKYKITKLIKKGNPVSLIWSKEELEEKIGLSRTDTTRKQSLAKQALAKELELKKISWTNENKFLAIVPKSKVNNLLEMKIQLDNTSYYLGELVSSVWLNSGLGFDDLTHTNRAEDPVVIFSPDSERAAEYLNQVDAKIKVKQVIKLGFKDQMSKMEAFGVNDLKEICDENKIAFRMYSSVSYVLHESLNHNVISNHRINDQDSENSVEIELVHQNDSLNENVLIVERYIDSLSGDLEQVGLAFQLMKMKHELFSACQKDFISVNDSLAHYTEIPKDLFDALEALSSNRYGLSQKKKINLLISKNKSKKILLIVLPQFVEMFREEFKQEKLTIISMTDPVDERYYLDPYDLAILVNPTKRYFKKWIYSQICLQNLILMPSGNLPTFERMLGGQLNTLQQLKPNYCHVLLNLLNNLRSNIKQTLAIKDSEDNSSVDMVNDISTEEEMKEINEIQKGKNDLNTISNRKFILKSGMHVNATQYYHPYVVVSGRIQSIPAFRVEKGTNLIDFEYSDRSKVIMHLYNSDESFKAAYIKSNFWKDKLINYVYATRIDVGQLQDRMNKIGLEYSIDLDYSVGFYRQWLNKQKRSLAPNNSGFIQGVGILTKDEDLITHFNDYYAASLEIRNKVMESKENNIKSLINQEITKELLFDSGMKARIETVERVIKQPVTNVSRSETNRFLR